MEMNDNQDIHWKTIDGTELGYEFNNEVWGLEIGTGRVIDPDGCPVTSGDILEIAVLRMFSELELRAVDVK